MGSKENWVLMWFKYYFSVEKYDLDEVKLRTRRSLAGIMGWLINVVLCFLSWTDWGSYFVVVLVEKCYWVVGLLDCVKFVNCNWIAGVSTWVFKTTMLKSEFGRMVGVTSQVWRGFVSIANHSVSLAHCLGWKELECVNLIYLMRVQF